MALKYQRYVDLPDGKMIGIHIWEPLSDEVGGNALVVAELSKYSIGTPGDACAQISLRGQTLLGTGPLAADAYTVTITLTAAEIADPLNNEIVIVTSHRIRRGNFSPEDTTPYSL